MRKFFVVLILSAFALTLSGCGKGIDAKLATESEGAYRNSLNSAFRDMRPEQQQAFNWAVSNFSLEQLIAKYPQITPRMVVSKEADEYIKIKSQEVATITAELDKNSERLAQEEKLIHDVNTELGKITVTAADLRSKSFGFGNELVFITKNESQFDVSSASWNTWLFIGDEQKSDRHCSIHAYYKVHGGLPQGNSLKYSSDVSFMGCRNWDTLEVKNAKNKRFEFKLDTASVQNYGDKKILPNYSPRRADYENAIKAAKDEIEQAVKAKATVQ